MAKQKNTPAADSGEVAVLTQVVRELTQQVRHLALILDEVREELIWAVRNDKFNAAGASIAYVNESLAKKAHEPEKQAATRQPVVPRPVLPTGGPGPTRGDSQGSLFT